MLKPLIRDVKLSREQAYTANKRAVELIQGAGGDQFSDLKSYIKELLKSNPNSAVKIQCAEFTSAKMTSK